MPGASEVSSLIQVVIPAKNERANLREVIEGALGYAERVLVIDGASTDGTVEESKAAGAEVIQASGRGKGSDLREAIPILDGQITVLMDADGSHEPGDIPGLVAPIVDDRADHVSASRLLGGSSELHGSFDEWARLAGSAFITACINWRYQTKLSESQNGFRAIRTEVLKSLRLRAKHTTIEQEMIVATLRQGYRMAEVPSHEYPRKHGESHISVWRDGWRYVGSLARLLIG